MPHAAVQGQRILPEDFGGNGPAVIDAQPGPVTAVICEFLTGSVD